MVAGSVLVLILLSSLSALLYGFRLLDQERMSALAGQLLQSQVESVRLLNWSQVGGTPGGAWHFQTKRFTGSLAAQNQPIDFTAEAATVAAGSGSTLLSRIQRFDLRVEPAPSAASDGSIDAGAARNTIVRVVATVTWNSADGRRTHTRSTETFYARDGAHDYYYTAID